MLYWAFGYSGQTTIVSGSAVTIPENGTTLRLDRFAFRIDPIRTRSGIVYQPIDYVSTLSVTPKDGATRRADLRVNHPARHRRHELLSGIVRLRRTVRASRKDGRPLGDHRRHRSRRATRSPLGDTARSLQYAKFVGTIEPNGTIGADPRPNNPGVLLDVFDGDQNIGSVLVPLGRSVDLGGGYRVDVGRYVLYSGIQYRHDPGIPFVLVGAFVLLAGLCMSFYFLPARLYVRVDGAATAWNVGIAATTVKGYDIYEEQFAALVREFEEQQALRLPAASLPGRARRRTACLRP